VNAEEDGNWSANSVRRLRLPPGTLLAHPALAVEPVEEDEQARGEHVQHELVVQFDADLGYLYARRRRDEADTRCRSPRFKYQGPASVPVT